MNSCSQPIRVVGLGLLLALSGTCLTLAQTGPAPANQDLETRSLAPWKIPAAEEILTRFENWHTEMGLDAERRRAAQDHLRQALAVEPGENHLPAFVQAVAIARPDLQPMIAKIESLDETLPAEFLDQLHVLAGHPWPEQILRQALGDHLIRRGLYDEALEALHGLDLNTVPQPQLLLLHRGLAHHQLSQKGPCQFHLQRLLEQRADLPLRHVRLAELMTRDIEGLEGDSLDEIARLMRDIERRIGLYRAGQQVLDQEKAVLDKLDRLIERLEEQQRQNAASSSLPQQPARPMDSSRPAGGKGSGDVVSKRFAEGGAWGDLPPAEKAETLAEMTRDLPPHYREIVEAYFQRLARLRDGKDDQ